MKALTLLQPWASLVAIGVKRWETRAWRTSYAGPLAIHASKGFPDDARLLAHEEEMLGHLPSPTALPRQAVLAVVRVVREFHMSRLMPPLV